MSRWIKPEHNSLVIEPFTVEPLPFHRILFAYNIAPHGFSTALVPLKVPPSKSFFLTVRSATRRYSLFPTPRTSAPLYTGQLLHGPVWIELWNIPNVATVLSKRLTIKLSKLTFPSGCCIVTPNVTILLDYPPNYTAYSHFCFPLYERIPPVS